MMSVIREAGSRLLVECDERSRFDRIVMAKRREGKAKRMSEVFHGRGVG
jgi:hypothetical protein